MFRVRGRSWLLLQCRFWTSSILSIADWSNMNVILRGHEQADQNHLCCRTNTRVIFKDKASNEPQKTKHSSLFCPHKINSITCFSKSPPKNTTKTSSSKEMRKSGGVNIEREISNLYLYSFFFLPFIVFLTLRDFKLLLVFTVIIFGKLQEE